MADKITSLKVASSTGIFGNEIPIGANASNVDITYGTTSTNVSSVLNGIRTGTYSVASATNASKVNNHTVNADVPSGAKFTDTTYSLASSSNNGLMSNTDYNYVHNIRNCATPETDGLHLIKPLTVHTEASDNTFTITSDSAEKEVYRLYGSSYGEDAGTDLKQFFKVESIFDSPTVLRKTLRVEGKYAQLTDYDESTNTTGSHEVALTAYNSLNSIALVSSNLGDVGLYRNVLGSQKWMIRCDTDGNVFLNNSTQALNSYVMARGSTRCPRNTNSSSYFYWHWWRYNNGLGICCCSVPEGGYQTIQSFGGLYTHADSQYFGGYPYPLKFINTPIEVFSLGYNNQSSIVASRSANTKTNAGTYRLLGFSSGQWLAGSGCFIVIGDCEE